MKNKTLGFNTAISELLDIPNPNDAAHPYQTIAKFILLDDKPNANKQGVPYSEFQRIISSAVGMPVKMHFDGTKAGDHSGSIPIGVIQKVTEISLPNNIHQLVAEAALWPEEFPDEIAFLKDAFASDKAPGISYELGYHDSESVGGIQWIKNIITQAATFVKTPAYGDRTRLLAIAAKDPQALATTIAQMVIEAGLQLPDVIDALKTLAGATPDTALVVEPFPLGSSGFASKNKGGKKMEEKELEALKVTAGQVPTLSSKITELEAALVAKDAEIKTQKDENATLKLASLVDNRTRQMVEAGITLEADAAKAEAKKGLIASLTDEQFAIYLEDIKPKTPATPAPAPAATAGLALASRKPAMPKLEVPAEETGTLTSLLEKVRSRDARNAYVNSEE